ncbi:Predicted membrane protein [Caulobacter sp. UNC279MFTsu5.1]|nr:Predicted membrane protein [Caulobacter sp. UNC279MFTsu5.1]
MISVSETILSRRVEAGAGADRILKRAGAAWFLVAALGQGAFAAYIVAFYWRAAVLGDVQRWNEVLGGHGVTPGQPASNLFLGLHLLLAGIVTVGGPLQLVPWVRARFIGFHRWNGRAYVVTAIGASLAAFYLVAKRGTIAGSIMSVAISLDGVLILACAAMAWRQALARRIDSHRRWAMRTFMVASGVWFYRVGLMAWFLVNRGPAGHTDSFDGPFDVFWAYGCYLLPLAVLELHQWVRDRGGAAAKLGMAGLIGAAALATGLGVFGAVVGMWLPRL